MLVQLQAEDTERAAPGHAVRDSRQVRLGGIDEGGVCE
jgi:hypothetical protein